MIIKDLEPIFAFLSQVLLEVSGQFESPNILGKMPTARLNGSIDERGNATTITHHGWSYDFVMGYFIFYDYDGDGFDDVSLQDGF